MSCQPGIFVRKLLLFIISHSKAKNGLPSGWQTQLEDVELGQLYRNKIHHSLHFGRCVSIVLEPEAKNSS